MLLRRNVTGRYLETVAARRVTVVTGPRQSGKTTLVRTHMTDTGTSMFHWQDRSGAAVDLVLETTDGRVAGLEVKAGQTPKSEWFRWLSRMRDTLGKQFVAGIALYTGQDVLPFGDRLLAVPIAALWEI